MSALDLAAEPYLIEPLRGTRLIEASAGTGKTFTLATLFTRLIVEDRLRMAQVLAVTYTDAATQELRRRIRERLVLAASLVGSAMPAEEGHEAALTRAVIDRHLARGDVAETAQQLAVRLRTAAEETDLASIFTIHGFCTRVLRDHALEAGQGLAADELLGNDKALKAQVAADLWRQHAGSPEDAIVIASLWSGPDALAEDLGELCGPLPLLPTLDGTVANAEAPDLSMAVAGLADAMMAHGPQYFSAVLAAIDAGVLNKNSYKADWVAKLQRALDDWCRHPDPRSRFDDKLIKLTHEALSKGTKKDFAGKTPASPLQPAIADWAAAHERHDAWREARCLGLLHALRNEGRTRLTALKRERRVQTYDDLIERVAEALDSAGGQALVARLRAQYHVALVDEFQDTDARQWHIFEQAFGAAPQGGDTDDGQENTRLLALIGDPKQAIYGFRGGDVATYLGAKSTAIIAPRLDHNFRSRPAVLRAIQALYDGAKRAGKDAFLQTGIAFEPVLPGTKRKDADYQRDGAPAPALTLRLLANDGDGARKAEPSRAAATAACVAEIHCVLSDARAGKALIDGKPVRSGDIAVLVRNHKEATRMQQELARAGVPAVAAGKQSLFATEEAAEVRALLLALNQPSDNARLRTALATVLLGLDAHAIAALDADGDAQREHQGELLGWRERWQHHGPLALLTKVCAQQAERLLGLFDGERRLTNYLQLAELLQDASARTLGLHGQLDWLATQIASADEGDETQLLRLESDAHRVKIVTLHKSKGLEYPLVFLPFAGLGTRRADASRKRVTRDGDSGARTLHWRINKDASDWKAAGDAVKQDEEAENARLLYVALTRAEHALWIAAGDVTDFDKSRLAPLLTDLPALRAHADIRIVEGPVEPAPPRLPAEQDSSVMPARPIKRTLSHDWWVYSFTQLANADSGGESAASANTVAAAGGNDEPAGEADADAPQPAEVFDPRFAGNRFGVVLHDALEHADFARWQRWQPGDAAPQIEQATIESALRSGGYAADEIEDGVTVLTRLIGQTLTVALPEGARLCDVPADARRPEIEFQFALQPTAIDALLRLLHAHGVVRERHSFGLRRQLEGLMTGLIDLTYQVEGRWYVLDYKSNRLPDYDAAHLARAMAHSEYDLQALIYTLALHRWLRFRLGDAYDYARDFGGLRYLFCRGLDATCDESPGVHAQRFAPELIDALDALFAGRAAGAAA